MLSGLHPCVGMTSATPSSMLQMFQITVCQKDEKSGVVIHRKTWTNPLSPASRWLVYLPLIKWFFSKSPKLSWRIYSLFFINRKIKCWGTSGSFSLSIGSWANVVLISSPFCICSVTPEVCTTQEIRWEPNTFFWALAKHKTFTDPNLPANSKIHGLLKRKINTVTSQHLMMWFFKIVYEI